jgi:hypothetical protein
MPKPGSKSHHESVPAHFERGQGVLMKAYYVIASLAAIALGGCTVYPTAPVAYTQPAVVTTPAPTVAPAYVAPAGSAVIVR